MGTKAEREVLVGVLPIEPELLGGLKEAFVSVGGRRAHDHAIALGHGAAAHFGVGDAADAVLALSTDGLAAAQQRFNATPA